MSVEDSAEPAEVVSTTLVWYAVPFVRPVIETGEVSAVPGVHSIQVVEVLNLYHTAATAVEPLGVVHERVIDWLERVAETEGAAGGSWTLSVFDAVHPAALQAST